ncbi:MAG TPA: right-handed parallel beta-helix repeat-containing protein [Thermosynechococcaceae cyanobacterium]
MAKANRRLFLSGALGLAGAGAAKSGMSRSPSEITVSTVKELVAAIGPDRTIKLKAGTYTLSDLDPDDRTQYAYFTETGVAGHELIISGADNLKILGEGSSSRILTQPRAAQVITFVNCRNVTLSNLEAGHSPEKGYCSGGVLSLRNCQNISVNNSVLFGSGTLGIQARRVNNLVCKNTVIQECTEGILRISLSKNFSFQGCQFTGNGQYDLVEVNASSGISFLGCQFKNNFSEPPVIGFPDGRTFTAPSNSYKYYFFKAEQSDPIQLTDCTIADNRVENFVPAPEQVKLVNTRFSNNRFALNSPDAK